MDAIKTGGLIAQLRKEKELTQKDLAEALHVSTQAVSKWERGLSCPDIGLLEPLAEALGLTVTELLSGQRGEEPGEEVVRNSLRFGLSQMGPKIRRWKGLFIAAAALLLALAAVFGYIWVRDNTTLIPQRETVLIPIELGEEQDVLLDLFAAWDEWDYLRMYRAVLADDMDHIVFKGELWRLNESLDRELIDSCHLGILYTQEPGRSGSRRQIAALRLTIPHKGNQVQYKLMLGGNLMGSSKTLLEELPRPIWGVGCSAAAGEPVTVDRETGAVLLQLDLALEPEEGADSMPYDYRFLVKAYWD